MKRTFEPTIMMRSTVRPVSFSATPKCKYSPAPLIAEAIYEIIKS